MSGKLTFTDLKQCAQKLLQNERYTESNNILLQMKEISPKDDRLLCKIGDVSLKLNNPIGAKWYYEQSLKINKRSHTYTKLGLLHHFHLQQLSKAEKYYLNATNLDPSNDYTYLNLAKLYIVQKRYADAEQSFKICLEIDNNKAATHYHYGLLLNEIRCYIRAYNHFKQCILIKSDIAKYHFVFAKSAMKLNYYKDAQISFLKCIQLSKGEDPSMLYEYAMAIFDVCRQESLTYLSLAIRSDPDNELYTNKYSELYTKTYTKDAMKYLIDDKLTQWHQKRYEETLCHFEEQKQQCIQRQVGEIECGMIRMFGGYVNDVPNGWILCDGNHGTPDLRKQFIFTNDMSQSGICENDNLRCYSMVYIMRSQH